MQNFNTLQPVVAYSYIRWSSAVQTKGDSFKRQIEKTRQVCLEKGWHLDESIKPDRGVSAYKGDNLRRGFLGAFLAKVEREEIPTPCVLLVEAWDRLSRQKLSHAQELLQDLLKRGVAIYTSNTGKLYDRSCLDDPMQVFQFLLEAQSAHVYSENISMRLKAAWKRKKEAARNEGKLLTKKLPAWIRHDPKENEFLVDESKADTVRQIFKMYLAGHGVDTISVTLNKKNTPTFSKRSKESGWAQSTIRRLLRSPSVIGSYQPQRYEGNERFNDGPEVENYYPAIIDKKTFFAASQAIEGRRGIRGPKRSVMNLFTGLVSCAHCGAPMTIKAGAVTKKRKQPWISLVCRNALRGKGCLYQPFRMEPFENAIVTVLLPNILQQLYPIRKPEEYEKLVADLKHVETQIANTNEDKKTLARVPQALWAYLDEKERERDSLRSRIAALPETDEYVYPYSKISNLEMEPLERNLENRLRVRAFLPSIVHEIILDPQARRAKLLYRIVDPVKQARFDKHVEQLTAKKGEDVALRWIRENVKDLHLSVDIEWPELDPNEDQYFNKNGTTCEFEDWILWREKDGANV